MVEQRQDPLTRDAALKQLGLSTPIGLSKTVAATLADLCDLMGGCEPGVAWGRAHHISEIADPEQGFETAWCVWMIDQMGDILTPELRGLFLDRVIAERSTRARYWWETLDYLTPDEYDRLYDAAKVNQDWQRAALRAQVQRGDIARRERRDG